MKKIFLLLIFILGFIPVMNSSVVSKVTAVEIAEKAAQKYINGFNGRVSTVEPVYLENKLVYYVVNFNPAGWIIVSGDDVVSPVLGYSANGNFSTSDMPDNCDNWMSLYGRHIINVSQRNSVKHAGWKELDKISVMSRAASDKVEPLIKVNWNQSRPYNAYCPVNSQGQAIVGCVAVAMAQAMSVCKYPSRPSGEFSYVSSNYGSQYINYDKEPAYDWNSILSGANNYNGAARLMWHCGVAVRMEYGVDGSGTQSSYIATALKRNFSYPESVVYYSRDSYSGDWKELIVNELQNGRAVCYSGADLKKGYGHCFNLDGYDGNTMFHVNWGWGGQNNGYFPLDGLKDATMDMDYTAQQGVVVGIRAASDKPSDIKLTSTSVLENLPVGTVVGEVQVSSEATNPRYEYSVRGEYSVILHDYIEVPFEIKDGKLVTTEVLDASKKSSWNMEITVTNVLNKASITKRFTIKVEKEDPNASVVDGVTLKFDKEINTLSILTQKSIEYKLKTTDNVDVKSGNLAENGEVSISLDGVEADILLLDVSRNNKQKSVKLKF